MTASLQVNWTLSILADLNNAVVRIISTPLISYSSTNFGIISSVQSTIVINVTHINHKLF